jgi:succinyl-CoA synthetase alpha subunit
MKYFFNPKSVIVVGASENSSKWGNWIAKDVLKHPRDIYFVNNNSGTVLNQNTYPTIKDVPYGADLGVVCVSDVDQSIVDLIENGVLNIIVITACDSFSENTLRIIKQYSAYVLGPNCPGVWDSYTPFHCIAMDLPVGNVGMISQSGGIVMDLAYRLKTIKLGFSRVLTIGNNLTFDLMSAIKSLEDDPNTEVIALYFETADVPYNYIKTINKPVILLSPWGTPSTIRAAKNHTGSVLKNINNAARNMMDFVGALQFVSSGMKIPSGRKTFIITDTGGGGVLLTSAAEFNALLIDEPTNEQFISTIKNVVSPQTKISNPLDLIDWSAGIDKSLFDVMTILMTCNDIDCIIVHIQSDGNTNAIEYANKIADLIESNNKVVFFSCYDYSNEGISTLLDRKIPVFREPETLTSIMNMICG